MGLWKASNEHPSEGKTAKIGSSHFDVYHTDKSGNRDQPHHTDVKISGSPHSSSTQDVHSSSSKK